jgi:hypothetical protein
MTYSNSAHFSNKKLCKTLFILNYGSKVINLARFAYLQEFQKTVNRRLSSLLEQRCSKRYFFKKIFTFTYFKL